MTDEKIQLVITARDSASKDVQGLTRNLGGLKGEMQQVGAAGKGLSGKLSGALGTVEGKLLATTRSARLLKRETFGVSKFANALDTLAGTSFASLIAGITTVAEVAHPLKDLGAAITDDVASAFDRLQNNPKVVAALDRGATFMSGRIGKVLASSAGILGIGAIVSHAVEDQLKNADWLPTNQIAQKTGLLVVNGTPVLAHAGKTLGTTLATTTSMSFDDGMKANFKSHAAWQSQVESSAAELGDTAGEILAGHAYWMTTQTLRNSFRAGERGDLTNSIKPHFGAVGYDAGLAMVKGVWTAMRSRIDQIDQAAKNWAGAIGNNFVKGIKDTRKSLRQTMDDLMWAIKHPMALVRTEARIKGDLTSAALQKALASKNPLIRNQALQTQQTLIGYWEQMTGKAWDYGQSTSWNLKNGLNDQYPEILQQARELRDQVNRIYAGFHFSSSSTGGINPATGKPWGQRAAGGPVSAGETYIVGERGPEVLHMGRSSGYVQPNAGSSPQPIQIFLDGRKIFDVVDTRMGKRLAMTSSAPYTRG